MNTFIYFEMSAGECQTKNKKEYDNDEDEKPIKALDEGALSLFFYCDIFCNRIF